MTPEKAQLRVEATAADRPAFRMLHHLGVRSVRLLSNNPRKVTGVSGEGVSVSERVPIEILATTHAT